MSMPEKNIREELGNIVTNAPVFAGDTISHATARICGQRGWAERDGNGEWIPTQLGISISEQPG